MTEHKWISVQERLPEFDVPVSGKTPRGIGIYKRVDDEDGWVWYQQTYCEDMLNEFGFECEDDYQIVEWTDIILPSENLSIITFDPSTHKLVPVEPTEAMLQNVDRFRVLPKVGNLALYKHVWECMLKAVKND